MEEVLEEALAPAAAAGVLSAAEEAQLVWAAGRVRSGWANPPEHGAHAVSVCPPLTVAEAPAAAAT
eukprot:305747-Chlamydomonas_euryale.AAC.1